MREISGRKRQKKKEMGGIKEGRRTKEKEGRAIKTE